MGLINERRKKNENNNAYIWRAKFIIEPFTSSFIHFDAQIMIVKHNENSRLSV